MADPIKLSTFPAHLGRGGEAHTLPEFTGDMSWYESYGQRHASDGADGRLVSMHTFNESWTSWEVHPLGSEIVLCTAGRMALIQESPDGQTQTVTLGPGEYAIIAPGVWHTADVLEAPAIAVFITSGEGTVHRAREGA